MYSERLDGICTAHIEQEICRRSNLDVSILDQVLSSSCSSLFRFLPLLETSAATRVNEYAALDYCSEIRRANVRMPQMPTCKWICRRVTTTIIFVSNLAPMLRVRGSRSPPARKTCSPNPETVRVMQLKFPPTRHSYPDLCISVVRSVADGSPKAHLRRMSDQMRSNA